MDGMVRRCGSTEEIVSEVNRLIYEEEQYHPEKEAEFFFHAESLKIELWLKRLVFLAICSFVVNGYAVSYDVSRDKYYGYYWYMSDDPYGDGPNPGWSLGWTDTDGTRKPTITGAAGDIVIPSSVWSDVGSSRHVTEIGTSAFEGLNRITSVEIPTSISTFCGRAFYGCNALTNVVFYLKNGKVSFTKIGYRAFQNCTSLRTMNIPNGVVELGLQVFSGCTNLQSVTFPGKVPSGFENESGLRETPAWINCLSDYKSEWEKTGLKIIVATPVLVPDDGIMLRQRIGPIGNEIREIVVDVDAVTLNYILQGKKKAMTEIDGGVLYVKGVEVHKTNVNARQRYPWNGLVDVKFTVDGSGEEKYDVVFNAKDVTGGTNLTMKTLLKANGVAVNANGELIESGTYNWVWNAAADLNDGAVLDQVVVRVDCEDCQGGVQLWDGGPIWAECNVGATKPEEYGYYFWWGDTVGYRGNINSVTCTKSATGLNLNWVSSRCEYLSGAPFVGSSCQTYEMSISQLQNHKCLDSAGNLAALHDAATAHLGPPWRMPTDAEFAALSNNCSVIWTTCNGVHGVRITGNGDYSSKSIFLPAAGRGFGGSVDYVEQNGYYWSSTPRSGSYEAWCLCLSSSSFIQEYCSRYIGQSVRPVRDAVR